MTSDPEIEKLAKELDAAREAKSVEARVEMGDAVEEIFGANLRSLRTLKTILLRPSDYFRAAMTPDYEGGRYTPALRLWLAIFSIYALTQFFWAGPNTPMSRAFEVESADEVEAIIFSAMEAGFITSQLIVSVLALLILAKFFRWGQATQFALNLRFVFGAMVPYIFVTLVTTLSTAKLPEKFDDVTDWGSFILTFGATWLYAAFGPAKAVNAKHPLPMGFLFAIAFFGLFFLFFLIAVMVVALGMGIANGF